MLAALIVAPVVVGIVRRLHCVSPNGTKPWRSTGPSPHTRCIVPSSSRPPTDAAVGARKVTVLWETVTRFADHVGDGVPVGTNGSVPWAPQPVQPRMSETVAATNVGRFMRSTEDEAVMGVAASI